jgi:hypothetical protein
MTRGTCRDLAGWFTWKQVGLGFPSLASTLVEVRRRWCMWHHRRGCIELKLNTDRSMRRAESDPTTLILSFSLYYALGAFYSFTLLLEPINRTL